MKGAERVYCVFDYETFSEANLLKVGAYEYARHPSTDILCAAWRIGTRKTLRSVETQLWVPSLDIGSPGPLVQAMLDPEIVLVAHNAFFEQVITRFVLVERYFYKGAWTPLRELPPRRWVCTAALGAALALPRSLDGLATALKLPVKKDLDGRRLMLKYSKPRKPTIKDDSIRHTDETDLRRIGEYCKTDIAVEVDALLTLPPLTPTERRIWVLDQEINWRGFLIDTWLVRTVRQLIDAEIERADQRVWELTGGKVNSATQVNGVRTYLKSQNVFLPNMQKKTIEDAVTMGLATGDALEVLQLRQAVGKTSTAKYDSFLQNSPTDGRIRDSLKYHAASTGRWAGSRVQPQNMPRPSMKHDGVMAAVDTVTGDYEDKLTLIRLAHGDPMSVFSDILRSMIIAPKGRTFDVADFAQIEVRVLFWLAGDRAGIAAFESGADLYIELARDIYAKYGETPIEASERQLGKGAILGCGFQMGEKRFWETCKASGQEVSPELAKRAVQAYRSRHKPVVELWKAVEHAAIAAVESPGRAFYAGRNTMPMQWQMVNEFLWCTLPSGRKLAYAEPTVRMEKTEWFDRDGAPIIRPKLYHWSVDPKTKQWGNSATYGGRLVENVAQACARDFMAHGMLNIQAQGHWDIVLCVHDELIAERDTFAPVGLKDFCALMSDVPPWGEGCPVKAEGWSGDRYRK